MYVRITDKTMKSSAGGIARACRQGGSSCIDTTNGRIYMSPVSVCTRDREILGFSFYQAVNELYANRAKPQALMVSAVLPETYPEEELRRSISELDRLCTENKLMLIPGSLEAAKLEEPSLFLCGYGSVDTVTDYKTKPGAELICAGSIAKSGMAYIAQRERGRLLSRFSEGFISSAQSRLKDFSIEKIAQAAGDSMLIPISAGGIMAALWDLKASFSGFTADIREIPIYQEIVEIAEYLEINPYKLRSDGSALIVTDESENVLKSLEAAGIYARTIGTITAGQGGSIKKDDEVSCIARPDSDEIYRFED